MSDEQRESVLKLRKLQKTPWHSPLHIHGEQNRFHITAACFEHAARIGSTPERMSEFESELLAAAGNSSVSIYAWTVLPNHYHILVNTKDVCKTLKALFQLHGRTSYRWNGEENYRGRQNWYNALEHGIKSDRHFLRQSITSNIHHNPIKHGYVNRWTEWPFSSAKQYLDEIGEAEALRRWKEYDIKEMGKWDI